MRVFDAPPHLRAALYDRLVTLEGDTWRIIGVGTVTEDGARVYLHLSSQTRSRRQRNGDCPVQRVDYYPVADVLAAVAVV